MNVKQIYNSYVAGEIPVGKAAEELYRAMNGIRKIKYTPKTFTLRNHIRAESIPEAKDKRLLNKKLALISAIKEKHLDVIIEAHLGKCVSSKHHKQGLAMLLSP